MLIIFVFFFIIWGLVFQKIFVQFLFSLGWLFYAFCNPRTKEIFCFYFYNFYGKTIIINWSYDSFVIVLPNTSFQSVKERIFLKFSTDSSFMVRVDILVFGHWLCILEFKIVNSLPRNTNLSSTVQVYHFFLGSINFQFMLSLVYTVYCRKQPSE